MRVGRRVSGEGGSSSVVGVVVVVVAVAGSRVVG